MDLALENRIDTDLRRLMLVDPTPLDDDLLDPALADIAQAADSHGIDHWVRRHADRGEAVRERALARLADRGIGIALPHRMEEHFADPERFGIDRYTSERAEHRRPGVYAPFGAAAHSCLGRAPRHSAKCGPACRWC